MKKDNLIKLDKIFNSIFELKEATELEKLDQKNFSKWDSLAQVNLIVAIESEFSITIDIAKYEKFTSYKAIKNLLDEFKL